MPKMSGDFAALQERLIHLVARLSYREGNFTLASGKASTFYVDVKTTALHPEGATVIGELGALVLQRDFGTGIDAVGGMTLGADPIATAISVAAFRRGVSWPAFIVRKESKGHGTGKYIEGIENLKPGARVMVLEDVVTTGGSSIQAVKRLREAGYEPLGVLAVVDREEGGAAELAKHGLPLTALATLTEVRQSYRLGEANRSG